MQSKTYAIIICGGSGSRLWPRSRSHRPKHLLQLNGGETMVQQTVARLNLPHENIFCVTEASHSDVLREQLSEIPESNIVVEPGRRGTASAIGLGLSRLREVAGDEAVALCMWADSLIPDTEHFQKTLAAWTEAAEESKKVVLLGIQPTYASTGLGYIRMGSPITDVGGPLYEVDAFVEKPDAPTAADYYKSGKYLWNSGLFAARVGVLWQELSRHIPDLVKNLEKLAKAKNADKAREIYLGLETEIIDYGLFEKSDNLGVLPATFQWAEGDWFEIDHHPKRQPPADRLALIDQTASSTAELVYDLLRALGWSVDRDQATCLLTGIVSDTSAFQNSNTTPHTMMVAASLLRAGANLREIVRQCFYTSSVPKLRLWGRAMARIDQNEQTGGVVSTIVTKEDIEETGAHPDDLEGLVNFLNAIPGVPALMLLTDLAQGEIKGSLRTRQRDIDVSALAGLLGGGGHHQAAGFSVPGSLRRNADDSWEIAPPSVEST